MQNLKSILVPFGGSDEELNTLNVAFNLARVFSLKVKVLNIHTNLDESYLSGFCTMHTPRDEYKNAIIELEKYNKRIQVSAKEKYI